MYQLVITRFHARIAVFLPSAFDWWRSGFRLPFHLLCTAYSVTTWTRRYNSGMPPQYRPGSPSPIYRRCPAPPFRPPTRSHPTLPHQAARRNTSTRIATSLPQTIQRSAHLTATAERKKLTRSRLEVASWTGRSFFSRPGAANSAIADRRLRPRRRHRYVLFASLAHGVFFWERATTFRYGLREPCAPASSLLLPVPQCHRLPHQLSKVHAISASSGAFVRR